MHNVGPCVNEAGYQVVKKLFTTEAGTPVYDDQNSVTVGDHGTVLMKDVHLIEKLAHFNRERIAERVACAKGVVLI